MSFMTGRLFDAAWYRLGATFRRRWPGYLSVVLLVGLVGGVAMASIAGARRTQSAFPAYLRATDASDLQFQTSDLSNVSNSFSSTDPLLKKLARLPHVAHVASAPFLLVIPAGSNGKSLPSALNNDDVQEVGSQGGMYFSQDRVTLVAGRMADPNRPDEMVAAPEAAHLSGWHLGETIAFDAYTVQQSNGPLQPPGPRSLRGGFRPSLSASSSSRARWSTMTSTAFRRTCSGPRP